MSLKKGIEKMTSSVQKIAQKQQIIKTFCDTHMRLLEHLETLIEEMSNKLEIKTMINISYILKKGNPKNFVEMLKKYVLINYKNEIETKDISFLCNHNFVEDFRQNPEHFLKPDTLDMTDVIIKNMQTKIRNEYKNNDKTSIIINDSLLKLNLLLKLSVLFDTL